MTRTVKNNDLSTQLAGLIARFRNGELSEAQLLDFAYPLLFRIARWGAQYAPTYDDVPDIAQHIAAYLLSNVSDDSVSNEELAGRLYSEAAGFARIEWRAMCHNGDVSHSSKVLHDAADKSAEDAAVDFENRVRQLAALEVLENRLGKRITTDKSDDSAPKCKRKMPRKARRRPDHNSVVFQLRRQLGLTQPECVQLLGIPIGRLRRFEQGLEDPPEWVIEEMEARLANCVRYEVDLSLPMDRIARDWLARTGCATSDELAAILGLSKKSIDRWLGNKYRPSDRVINRYAQRVMAYVQAREMENWVDSLPSFSNLDGST